MNVRLLNESALEIEINSHRVVYAYQGSGLTGLDFEDPNTLVVGSINQAGLINRPGEYEFLDITVIALEAASANPALANVFAIRAGGVGFLFLAESKPELKKEHWDLIGKVDIYVTNMKLGEDIHQIINKCNPAKVVAINFGSAEEAAKATDLSATEPEKKLKVTADEFTEEEPSTVLVLLTK